MNVSLIIEISNYLASTLYAICTIPQIIKIVKTKSSDDISVMFVLMYTFAGILTEIFGIYHGIKSIWIPGIFSIILNIITIILVSLCQNLTNSKFEIIEEMEEYT